MQNRHVVVASCALQLGGKDSWATQKWGGQHFIIITCYDTPLKQGPTQGQYRINRIKYSQWVVQQLNSQPDQQTVWHNAL